MRLITWRSLSISPYEQPASSNNIVPLPIPLELLESTRPTPAGSTRPPVLDRLDSTASTRLDQARQARLDSGGGGVSGGTDTKRS
jgi:hypothetical protein